MRANTLRAFRGLSVKATHGERNAPGRGFESCSSLQNINTAQKHRKKVKRKLIEKETMERVIEKANNPKVAEAAAIFASGYSSGYDAGVAAGSEKETEDKDARPA